MLLSGAERFAVELVRRYDEVLGGLTQPQMWALAGAVAGLVLLVMTRRSQAAPRPAAAGSRLAPPGA